MKKLLIVIKNKILILGIIALSSVNTFSGWANFRDELIETVKESIQNSQEESYYEDDYDTDYYYDETNEIYYQNPDNWNLGNCRYGC